MDGQPQPTATARRALSLRAALLWLALNAWLFAPGYLFSHPRAPFWPPLPRAPFGALWALLVSRANLDLFRISIEVCALSAALLWAATTPWRESARRWAARLYTLLWLFLVYQRGVTFGFRRPAALSEDARLTLNLAHFLGSQPWPILLALALGVPLLLSAVRAFAGYAFGAFARAARLWPLRRRQLLAGALLVPAVLIPSAYGVRSDQPVFQLLGKCALDNWRAMQAQRARVAALRNSPPDRRYRPLLAARLTRKPDVYLLMVEAYGEILATWDMRDAYRALLARVEARLAARGYHARSIYSASPVHGGASWLSIATVHTGMLIDTPLAYSELELVGGRVPSLTRFFEAQGYRTHTLQPGTTSRRGLHYFDLFNHDVVVTGRTLDYHGKAYGFGVMPDQWTIGKFRERYWDKAPSPRYAFYMAISTHWPWGDGVPPHVRDFHAFERGTIAPDDVSADWPALPFTERIGSDYRKSYFRSIAYEFRLLCEWLEAEADRDSVVLIVGDHQPRLELDTPGEVTMNTPVHVLSRDASFVERFAKFGFQPGLYADPKAHAPLEHAALFSLLVSQLTAAYGAGPTTYYPHGIGLAGLNR